MINWEMFWGTHNDIQIVTIAEWKLVQKIDLVVRYCAEFCLCLTQLIHEELNSENTFESIVFEIVYQTHTPHKN